MRAGDGAGNPRSAKAGMREREVALSARTTSDACRPTCQRPCNGNARTRDTTEHLLTWFPQPL